MSNGRRSDEKSLRQPLEESKPEHPPPQGMRAEVNEAGPLGIAKRTLFQNASGQSREREHRDGHYVIRPIRYAGQPAVQCRAADKPSGQCRNDDRAERGEEVPYANNSSSD